MNTRDVGLVYVELMHRYAAKLATSAASLHGRPCVGEKDSSSTDIIKQILDGRIQELYVRWKGSVLLMTPLKVICRHPPIEFWQPTHHRGQDATLQYCRWLWLGQIDMNGIPGVVDLCVVKQGDDNENR